MPDNAIGECDVLCGRGGATNNHVGNMRFRNLVSNHQTKYLEARKKEKAIIAREVVEMVHRNGGRFLKRDEATKCWVEVPMKKALEKSSQALREGLDVRHKRVRTFKPRSENEVASRRKRPRVVSGKVIVSPRLNSLNEDGQSIPDLKEESGVVESSCLSQLPVPLYNPSPLENKDCKHVCEV